MHRIQWLEDLDSDQVQEFLEFLKDLYPGETGSIRRQHRRRIIQHIFVPIIEAGLPDHEFFVPESIEFTTWAQRLKVNPLEILPQLYQLFQKMNHPLDSIRAGSYVGRSDRTMRRLALTGAIPARKIRGNWQFRVNQLNDWINSHA
jgi:hypothetical protein